MESYRSETVPEEQPLKKSTRSGCLAFVIDTVETVLLALVLFLIINAVSARVRVENISMQPTLHPGQFLLVNKLAYKIGKPSHGDIVIFHHSEQEDYIKRVIGLPGDVVRVSDNAVYVNDIKLIEPYIAAPPAYNNTWTIPEDSLFVLGDNRNQSSDSHVWGYVPFKEVIGKAVLVYWPLENFQLLQHPDVVVASSQ